jgi:hypothetical protein
MFFSVFCSGTGLVSVVFYLIAALAVVMLFIHYAKDNSCMVNRIFLGINTGLCILLSFITILPWIEKCKYGLGGLLKYKRSVLLLRRSLDVYSGRPHKCSCPYAVWGVCVSISVCFY